MTIEMASHRDINMNFYNHELHEIKSDILIEASQIIDRTKAILETTIEIENKETIDIDNKASLSTALNPPITMYQQSNIESTHQFSLPVLFLASTFLSLCNLPPSQFIQYLCSLEPQLPDLNRILDNLLIEIDSSSSISIGSSSANISGPSPISTTFTTAVSPHAPIYLYHKHSIKRKASHLASEELLAKVNGFILAVIFYSFHRQQHPPRVFANEQERMQYEQDTYATRKQVFLNRYHDLLQTNTTLSDLDLYYLVNYEYVITWIYQNIFSIGKQVNQEYVIIAGMALEGSHRILSRGGGSGNVRKVREEIYRQVSGKAKQKRVKKESPKNQKVASINTSSSVMDGRDGESWEESEEEQLKSSPVINEHSDFSKDQQHHDRDSPVPMLVVDEEQQKMRIACHDPAFTSLLNVAKMISPSPSSPLGISTSITGKRRRESDIDVDELVFSGTNDESSPLHRSDDERSQASGGVSPLHWKKKIKLMMSEDCAKRDITK